MNHLAMAAAVAAFGAVAAWAVMAGAGESGGAAAGGASRLAVMWTSGDPDVAHKVCFMYTGAAKSNGWFDDVRLIVWGPSAKLAAEDPMVQAGLKQLAQRGVRLQACVSCSDSYGVSDDLRELGIEVKAMGAPLTDLLKSDTKLLHF